MVVGGQPHAPATSTPGNEPVPIVQEAGCAPGPVWTGGKSRPHRDSIPDRPARSSVAIPTELPPAHNHSLYYRNAGPSTRFTAAGIYVFSETHKHERFKPL